MEFDTPALWGFLHDVYVSSFQQTHQDVPSFQPRICLVCCCSCITWGSKTENLVLHLEKTKQTDKKNAAADWSLCGFYLNDRVFQVTSLLQQWGAALPVLLQGLELHLQISPALGLGRALAQTPADLQRFGVRVGELTEGVFDTLGKRGGHEKVVALKLCNLMNRKPFQWLAVINRS